MGDGRRLRNFFYSFFLTFSLLPSSFSLCSSVNAQELTEQQTIAVRTASTFSYNLQKYTGFNFLVDFVMEAAIKTLLKVKTKAKLVEVDLKTYSGWDVIRKKAKSLSLKADNLFIKNIPVENFELITNGPLYFKKNTSRKNQAAIPIDMDTKTRINLDNVTEVLNTLPKWKKIFEELDLPIPPFGYTKVSLHNLDIKINEKGLVGVNCIVRSVINPESEPLKMVFSGFLTLRENKLIISNIQTEIEDIFTNNSDVSKSFSEMLEDLINPIFDFHKFERGGLRIVHADLIFGQDKLVLKINIRLLPEENEIQ